MTAITSATPASGASRKIPGLLAGASAIWGIVLLALAASLPIVSVQEAPTFATQASTDTSPTPTASSASTVLHAVPRVTLVTYDGPTVLLLVAVPLLVSIVVGLLLWLRAGTGSTVAGVAAWTLSAVLLTAALVGFVTFLIGIAVIPNGILLVLACVLTTSSSSGRDAHLPIG